jgi:hypothetical protein
MWLDALGLALALLGVRGLDWCLLRWFLTFLLHEIYRSRQRVVCCMVMSNLTTLTSMSYFLIYPQPHLVF